MIVILRVQQAAGPNPLDNRQIGSHDSKTRTLGFERTAQHFSYRLRDFLKVLGPVCYSVLGSIYNRSGNRKKRGGRAGTPFDGIQIFQEGLAFRMLAKRIRNCRPAQLNRAKITG